ncbi:hypothetical protein GLOIN_2v1848252 [Rhizophagus irregularis DAOM 181602=DAOM 197198]|uniref:Uncharacterized protein n=1 Tax=Rhizophagus irregularis (strain DAOM 181602 / DAOM 197198 / MUCL 43194) TaxID=747089 RepID=A0A2P4P1T1_RHIID|nr:hypothetical protein GLOIN_2v1848252 [Rhizophagus irregularis DAOM 181602=DAOM 197198]POG59332.1 hypothetical protein GLOIN_2v1848252 [Rhizophagus irregularis DAOM 181602=DAOM 197198]|eukprot:XP_025166198.1 hypothetical protein GLOIN_2v1848252 [Rhizophagus irregularis DAOM 181602=DAOM 197198]
MKCLELNQVMVICNHTIINHMIIGARLIAEDHGERNYEDLKKKIIEERERREKIYGYICANSLRYGVLSIYDQMWFLKRKSYCLNIIKICKIGIILMNMNVFGNKPKEMRLTPGTPSLDNLASNADNLLII